MPDPASRYSSHSHSSHHGQGPHTLDMRCPQNDPEAFIKLSLSAPCMEMASLPGDSLLAAATVGGEPSSQPNSPSCKPDGALFRNEISQKHYFPMGQPHP